MFLIPFNIDIYKVVIPVCKECVPRSNRTIGLLPYYKIAISTEYPRRGFLRMTVRLSKLKTRRKRKRKDKHTKRCKNTEETLTVISLSFNRSTTCFSRYIFCNVGCKTRLRISRISLAIFTSFLLLRF